MAADVFGRELLSTGAANDSTVGAALVALQAVTGGGQAENYRPEIIRTLEPHEGACEAYEPRYRRYLEYYLRSASDE